MKEKIFAALKASILINGKTSISDKTLNTYVDSISAQITDESQITEAIKPHVAILKEIQANINAVAAESVSTTKTEYEKRIKELEDKNPNPNPNPEPPKPDDMAAQIKAAISESLKPLQEKLTAIETEKTQKTFLQQTEEQLKTANIPDWYSKNAVSGREFKSAEDVTRFTETLKTEWESAKQHLANGGFQEAKPPTNGSGGANESDAIAALIDKGTKEIIEQKKQ
ncbi:MAG: hypothetical protein LBS55_06540 [Prevotellaceae bacterium]|nr:hypothetical protein [Prevotellaceae bacterium]